MCRYHGAYSRAPSELGHRREVSQRLLAMVLAQRRLTAERVAADVQVHRFIATEGCQRPKPRLELVRKSSRRAWSRCCLASARRAPATAAWAMLTCTRAARSDAAPPWARLSSSTWPTSKTRSVLPASGSTVGASHRSRRAARPSGPAGTLVRASPRLSSGHLARVTAALPAAAAWQPSGDRRPGQRASPRVRTTPLRAVDTPPRPARGAGPPDGHAGPGPVPPGRPRA